MKLLSLEKHNYHVTAVIETKAGEDFCPLTEFLSDKENGQYSGSVDGFYSLIELFAASGREALNDKQCHYIHKKEKIWEFIKGDLRVCWFYPGKDKIIICSHGFVKQGQKADKKEVNKALKIKKAFEAQKDNIEIIEEDQDNGD